MNVVLGSVGAAIASWLFSLLGITFAGWLGYLIAGFIGACISWPSEGPLDDCLIEGSPRNAPATAGRTSLTSLDGFC
jgi:Transglycosylase associated protein